MVTLVGYYRWGARESWTLHCKHLAHQVWGGLGEQFFQIRGGIDMMGVSGHRGYIPFEDRLKLIRKVPVMVALLCTGTRLTTGYRDTTLVDATEPSKKGCSPQACRPRGYRRN